MVWWNNHDNFDAKPQRDLREKHQHSFVKTPIEHAPDYIFKHPPLLGKFSYPLPWIIFNLLFSKRAWADKCQEWGSACFVWHSVGHFVWHVIITLGVAPHITNVTLPHIHTSICNELIDFPAYQIEVHLPMLMHLCIINDWKVIVSNYVKEWNI